VSIVPPFTSNAVDRLLHVLTSLVTAWVLFSGVALIANDRNLSAQPAWQPAQWDHHVSLVVYGIVFLAAGFLLTFDLVVAARRAMRMAGAGLAGFVALFLSISLVVGAIQSGIGWMGAISNLFVVTVLTVVIRHTRREHPAGRP
jgi:hypothetical protein